MIFHTLGQINKNVYQVAGLKIIGRVGTHIFSLIIFSSIILCILNGISPFKMHYKYFPENQKKSRFQL